jgi:hypothetical protein
VSTQEAALLRLKEKALKGDARSIVQILELAKIFNNSTAVESAGDEALAAEDQAILDAHAEDVRSRPPSDAITVKPSIRRKELAAHADRHADAETGSAPSVGAAYFPNAASPAVTMLNQPGSVPASTAVPTAAAKQHNENNNDEKRGDIHLRLPSSKCCILRSLDF